MEQFTGKVWLMGDDIDTDIILPTEYLVFNTIDEMKPYAFSPLREDIAKEIKPGDIIVAGNNFGCGSSREQAPEVVKALGVKCIIARSFARIFFRNAINNGLLLIENAKLAGDVREGDCVTVSQGRIDYNGKVYQIAPLPDNVAEILEAGGLVKAMRKRNGLED